MKGKRIGVPAAPDFGQRGRAVCGSQAPAAEDAQKVVGDLHRKIGQLQVECDFLAGQPAISRVLRGGR